MPILRVSALPQRVNVTDALSATCVALAAAMGTTPDQVWGTWETVPYVEGDNAPEVQPYKTHPPIVELMALEGRPPELQAKMLTCVGMTLSQQLGIEPGNVYVRYVEMAKRTVFSGGRVLGAE